MSSIYIVESLNFATVPGAVLLMFRELYSESQHWRLFHIFCSFRENPVLNSLVFPIICIINDNMGL